MKNKKLLAAAMALLLPMAVMAQTAFKGQLRISNERISVQGEHYFDYDTTIPFAEWMREASLYIESE